MALTRYPDRHVVYYYRVFPHHAAWARNAGLIRVFDPEDTLTTPLMSLFLLRADRGHSSNLHPTTYPKAHDARASEHLSWVACLDFGGAGAKGLTLCY